ncbi:MAG: TolC family protein, partial [Myxococcota bacterium]
MPPIQEDGLSLDDAVARAIAREPSLRAAQAEIAIALGERRQASLRPNPTVTLERRDEPGGSDSTTTIGVVWPLDLFRRSPRVESAEHDVAAARFAAADHERLLVAEVRTSYGAAVAALREVAIADELAASVARQVGLLRARAEAGAARPLDRDLLEVELGRLRAERVRAASRADAATVMLKRQLGMDPGDPLTLRDPLEALVNAAVTPDSATISTGLPGGRPDVEEAEARIAAAEARAEQARSEGRFDVSVVAGYMRMNSGFPQLGFEPGGALARVQGGFNYLSAGAMISVPLFDRNQGRIESAQAEQARARAARDAAVLAATTDAAIAG